MLLVFSCTYTTQFNNIHSYNILFIDSESTFMVFNTCLFASSHGHLWSSNASDDIEIYCIDSTLIRPLLAKLIFLSIMNSKVFVILLRRNSLSEIFRTLGLR